MPLAVDTYSIIEPNKEKCTSCVSSMAFVAVLLFPVLHSRLSSEGLCRHQWRSPSQPVSPRLSTLLMRGESLFQRVFQLIDSSENDVGIGTCRRRWYFPVPPCRS